jgi:hypothetical protein
MAAVVGIVAKAVLGKAFVSSIIGKLVVGILGSIVSSFVKSAFESKPGAGGLQNQGRTDMIRQPITPRRVLYGDVKVSGPLVFVHTTDSNNLLHLIIALGHNQSNSITTVWFDDEEITYNSSTGVVTDPSKFVDHAWVYPHLGSPTQTVDASLASHAGDKWTSNHRLRGVTYLYVRLKWSNDVYPNGIPNISAQLQGNNQVLDTRTAGTGFSRNPALCIRDYLVNTEYGLSVPSTEIDETSFNAAANVCEETVSLKGGGNEFRYQLNGVVDLKNTPDKILGEMLTTMQGILTYENGKFKIFAGEYRTPTQTITLDDIVGPISVQTRIGAKSLYNGVRGTYISPDNDWQPSDFPAVQDATLVTEDGGEEKWLDIEMPFTTSTATCQRIAKILLSRNREQIVVSLQCNLDLMPVTAGDVVNLTIDRYGWSAKTFEVKEWHFDITNSEGGDPLPIISLTLHEIASSNFNWTAADDEIEVETDKDTLLPDPFTIAAPTNLTAVSGTNQLIINDSGDIVSRVKLSWTASTNAFVLDGGGVEVQYKRTTASTWDTVALLDPASNEFHVAPVKENVDYDLRVRFVNYIGARSDWTQVSAHTVIGKTELPPNVSTFTVTTNQFTVLFKWSEVTIPDLAGYEIRYGAQGTNWANATPLTQSAKGTESTTVSVPPGTWSFLIKAVDTTGNYSAGAAVFGPLTLTNANSVLQAVADGEFPGTLENFYKHYSNQLVPEDKALATGNTQDVFDISVQSPQETCTYTSSEIDLGSDQSVRIWGDIVSELMPGETTGIADPKFQISYRVAADSSALASISDQNLISESGSYTGCQITYDNQVTPTDATGATANDQSVFDTFVQSHPVESIYEAVEIDLGADTNINLSPQVNAISGPGESGTINYCLEIDYRTSAGSYDGFESFTGGTVNARYIKLRVQWPNSTGTVGKLTAFRIQADNWQEWSIGTVTARYIQARVVLDTTVGVAKITDFNWTVDQE